MRTARVGVAVRALVLVLAALVPAGSRAVMAAAAPVELAVSSSLEPAVIRIGDAARLTVTVDHPAAGAVELPELEQGRAIVVTDRTRETAALAGGRLRTTFVVSLTSFEVGEHRGGGQIGFAGPGGVAAPGAPLPGMTLRVTSVLAGEDAPPRGPKGLIRWPAPAGRWAGFAAGVLLLAAAVFLGARRQLARRRRRPAVAAPVAASPNEEALGALAALAASQPIPYERVEPSYRELSSIVRRYLEGRLGLKAPERTTEEFIREAAGSGLLAPAHQQLARAFLEQCDLVKFARQIPSPADVAAAIAAAERLVRET